MEQNQKYRDPQESQRRNMGGKVLLNKAASYSFLETGSIYFRITTIEKIKQAKKMGKKKQTIMHIYTPPKKFLSYEIQEF